MNLSPLNKSIGHKVRRLRKQHGLTTAELGKILNVSQQQISRYECGINHIHIDLLEQISFYFKVPIEYFLINNSDEY